MEVDGISIDSGYLIGFLLIFFRIGGVLHTAPYFGSRNIPGRVKIMVSFTIAVILLVSSGYKIPAVQFQGVFGLALIIIREVLLGIAIGYTARLTFVGIQLAGQFVGHEMGFAMMRIMDPTTRANVTVVSQYNTIVAMLVFLLVSGHHYILKGLAGSFSEVPPGQWAISEPFIQHLNGVFASIFSTALKIAIPVMATLFLTKVALAIVARTMPQMNVFVVGFPLQISIGLIAMAVSLPLFIKVLQALFITMRDNVMGVYQ